MTRAHWIVLAGLMMAGCGGEMAGDEQSASELDTGADGKADTGAGPNVGTVLLYVVDSKGHPVSIKNISGRVDVGTGVDLAWTEPTEFATGIAVARHRSGTLPIKVKDIKFDCVKPSKTIALAGKEIYYDLVSNLEAIVHAEILGSPPNVLEGLIDKIGAGLKILSTEFHLYLAGGVVVADCSAGTFSAFTEWHQPAAGTGGSTGMVPPLGTGPRPPLGTGTGTVPPLGGGTSTCSATRYSCSARETAAACATRNRTECPRASITSTGKLACCF